MRLGTLLLRNASIGLSQLESALRNQVLYGGRLGTNLVELGFVEVDLLSGYLAELSGVPSASSEMLDAAPTDALARLGGDLAHQLGAIPLGNAPEPHGSIAVAMINPHDRNALAVLKARLGGDIAPYVMPELRAFYYLERHFGQPRQARFVRSGGRLAIAAGLSSRSQPAGGHGSAGSAGSAGSESSSGADRRRVQPPSGIVMPPPLVVPPRSKRPSARSSQVPPDRGEPALSFAAACDRMAAATQRGELAETLVAYAAGRFNALVVFLVRDANAMGWRGTVASAQAPIRFEELSIPLGSASAFQAAHDTLSAYSGASPAPAHPIESKLWEALGEVPEPREVTVVPVILKQRVVNLIYAHATGGISADLVDELSVLAQHAQDAYLRLIRQSKG